MAQAQQDLRVQPEVFVLMFFSLSHFSFVTCFATRECTDLMTGNSPDMLGPVGSERILLLKIS